MTATDRFRLGDMLSLTLQAPLSFRWPITEDRALKLLLHMTEGRLDLMRMQDMIDLCASDLRQQYPWLGGLDIPDFVRDSGNWAVLYAWLDKMEIKYGEWHPIRPLANASEIPSTEVRFDQLPPEIQARLRQMGYEPEE